MFFDLPNINLHIWKDTEAILPHFDMLKDAEIFLDKDAHVYKWPIMVGFQS